MVVVPINPSIRGDNRIGRGSRQRKLDESRYCNECKVSQSGRDVAIRKFKESSQSNQALQDGLLSLWGLRLVCHCRPQERCHDDAIIDEFLTLTPTAFDRSSNYLRRKPTSPPWSKVVDRFLEFPRTFGSTELLMYLALGKVLQERHHRIFGAGRVWLVARSSGENGHAQRQSLRGSSAQGG